MCINCIIGEFMVQTYDNYYKEYYKKNKDRITAYRKKRYAEGGSVKEREYYYKNRDVKDSYTREWQMWNGARTRAKEQGLPFDISPSDIVIPEFCPILGIKLDRDRQDKTKQSSPSLDKVIPELGYVKGNIEVISYRANRMKSDLTMEVINKLVEYIKKDRTPSPA